MDLTPPEDLERMANMLEHLGGGECRYNYQKRFLQKTASIVWGDVTGVLVQSNVSQQGFVIGIIQDITAKKEAEARLEYLDYNDELTGLPNRKLLTDRLEHAISSAKRSKGKVAVLMLGLDRFSRIADSIDQETANLILCELTGRLGATVRTSDTLARIGDTSNGGRARKHHGHQTIGDRCAATQQGGQPAHPCRWPNLQYHRQHRHQPVPRRRRGRRSPLRAASHAMHRAKLRGGDLYEYHVPEWNTQARELLTMEADLRAALDRNEFVLFYQPQVEMATGKVAGFEALVRWRHPQRGLVPPGDFISLAEETGVIVPRGMGAP